MNPVLESSQYTNFKAFNLETTVTNTKQTNSNLMQENKQRIYDMDIKILDENSENCLPEFILCNDTKNRPNRKPLKAFQSLCFPIMKAPGRSVPTYYNGSTLKKPEPINCDCLVIENLASTSTTTTTTSTSTSTTTPTPAPILVPTPQTLTWNGNNNGYAGSYSDLSQLQNESVLGTIAEINVQSFEFRDNEDTNVTDSKFWVRDTSNSDYIAFLFGGKTNQGSVTKMVYLQFKQEQNSLFLYYANVAYITQAFNPSNNLDYYNQTFTNYGDLHDVRGVGLNPTDRYGVRNLILTYTYYEPV